MTDKLTNDELKKYLINIDDHTFSLNRFTENIEGNQFEIRKEIEMIYNHSEDFLEEKYGVKNRINIDKEIYKDSLEKILEYIENGGRDINRIVGICCDGLYESRN
ncbi:hypothetical protein R0K17_17235 [Planococcus sp. SIMBA_143]|jgi:hypothetical protein|tara:strand:+ start:998 stop:1312 length:315 start_codon:yes stop_codon:yes gene_type:complete